MELARTAGLEELAFQITMSTTSPTLSRVQKPFRVARPEVDTGIVYTKQSQKTKQKPSQ